MLTTDYTIFGGDKITNQESSDPRHCIGKITNGIEILDIYTVPCGAWGAQVRCSCGRVFKTTIAAAKNMKQCRHIFKQTERRTSR